MGARGPRSLNTMTGLPSMQERPAAPASLPKAAKTLWERIVAAYPAGHFHAAHVPLLESYCRAVLLVREADQEIDEQGILFLGKPNPALAIRDQAVKQMTQLATKLRIAISSAYRADSVKVRPKESKRPWET